MKTVAIIQARLQSTRLPAKVLCEIEGKTMLQRVVERTKLAQSINEVVIATSDSDADRLLIDYCQQQNWPCIAGSEQDVLSRYVAAAEKFSADHVVRITSDCPLIDPEIIDDVVSLGAGGSFDYACNFYPNRRFPRGLDCEFLTRNTLERIDRLAFEPRFREHVTLSIYENGSGDRFTIGSVDSQTNWSHLRWTVDTPADLKLVKAIYRYFGSREFRWLDVLDAYSRNPHWLEINHGTIQKVA